MFLLIHPDLIYIYTLRKIPLEELSAYAIYTKNDSTNAYYTWSCVFIF